MKYKAGQLVLNKKLGLGKVLEVSGDNVIVFFKDQAQNPRTINVRVVPMALAKDQTDPGFDAFHPAKRLKKGWSIKKKPKSKTK